MTTEQGIQRSEPKGSTAVSQRVPYREIMGSLIGVVVGAFAGHLIDATLTDEPYAG